MNAVAKISALMFIIPFRLVENAQSFTDADSRWIALFKNKRSSRQLDSLEFIRQE